MAKGPTSTSSKVFKLVSLTIGAVGALTLFLGNIEKIVDFSNSVFGIGPLDLAISDPVAREVLGDNSASFFTVTFTVQKKWGILASKCELVFVLPPVVYSAGIPIDLARYIQHSRNELTYRVFTDHQGNATDLDEIDIDPDEFARIDGGLKLKNAAYLKCGSEVSNTVDIHVP
ncbi:hypothetical protein NKI96_21350 [Mesorhizobium sp. M0292]|uniref:hypothetical protein n=1 Tax=Mesorhizobium sp. M0292 TaxID=2956929 RepID=UPI0033393DDE